jgi:hypothetical protein
VVGSAGPESNTPWSGANSQLTHDRPGEEAHVLRTCAREPAAAIQLGESLPPKRIPQIVLLPYACKSLVQVTMGGLDERVGASDPAMLAKPVSECIRTVCLESLKG